MLYRGLNETNRKITTPLALVLVLVSLLLYMRQNIFKNVYYLNCVGTEIGLSL